MKNFNLIKRLFMDSHEKQSPQRFGRYAVMLIMLLTLGVGQMWAYNYKTSHGGFWETGGLVLTWSKNGSTSTTSINASSIGSGASLSSITTGLTLTQIQVKGWNTDHYANICEATVYCEMYKGSTKIDGFDWSTSTKSWSSNNCTFTMTPNKNFMALTTGPGNDYKLRFYAKITGADTDDYYGDVSYKGCSTTTWWYNKETTNGYYEVTFTVPSKNLTVAGAANGNTVSGSVTGIAVGTAYDITATPTAGYAFNGWSTSASHITIGNTSSASTTVTFNNYSNDATVTASFVEEETHDVTVKFMCGEEVLDSYTESAVGVTTTRSVDVRDFDQYEFTGWDWTANGVTSSSSSTADPVVINSVHGGSNFTLIANYKKLTRLYFSNPGSWSKVYAYVWDGSGNSGWKSNEITSQTKTINCRTCYYFEYDATVRAWVNILFHNGEDGGSQKKTADLTISGNEDKYYNGSTWIGDFTAHTITVDTEDESHGSVSGGGSTRVDGGDGCIASVTATPAAGYRFKEWVVTTGTATVTSPTSRTSTVTASTDAVITATFTTDGIIFLDKTAISSNWGGGAWVYFYSSPYWDNTNGSGSKSTDKITVYGPYAMTRIGDSQIYYYDYSSTPGAGTTKQYVAFTDREEGNWANFGACSAIYRGDFYPKMPMLVVRHYMEYHNTNACYYNKGFWMKYNDTDPGYVLKEFNGQGGGSTCIGTKKFSASEAGSRSFTATINITAGTKWFKVKGCDTTIINGVDYRGTWYSADDTMNPDKCSNWVLYDDVSNNFGLAPTAEAPYKFTLTLADGYLRISAEYPMEENDYRVVYNGHINTDAATKHDHASNFIRHLKAAGTQHDTVSFFIDPAGSPTLRIQKCTDISGSTVTWENVAGGTISLAGISKAGVYNFDITQVHNGSSIAISGAYSEPYSGNYYIRSDAAAGGWEAYKETANNQMEFSNFSKAHSGYDYYHCHYVSTGRNVKFCIANDYSSNITDTLENDTYVTSYGNLPYECNVRFMYNNDKNTIGRAYLNGSYDGSTEYLALYSKAGASTDSIKNIDGSAIDKTAGINHVKFQDMGNWVYQKDIQALPGTHVRLISNYRFNKIDHLQYFKGSDGDWNGSTTEQLIGGTTSNWQKLRLVYDFKTNHLIGAWLVPNEDISETLTLDADVMIIRTDQGNAEQITFGNPAYKLNNVNVIYSTLHLTYNHIANKKKTDGTDSTLTRSQREYYWVSFPYNVKIEDIFGSIGEFNNEWGIMYYDGKERAEKGYWTDSESFWKYFTDRSDTLKAFEGYVVGVDIDMVGQEVNKGKWVNGVRDVYLYFPSDTAKSIVNRDTTITIDQTGYECTIDRRTDKSVANVDKDRRIADSYWHCIGVPSFHNVSHKIKNNWIDPETGRDVEIPDISDWKTGDVPYLYVWNPVTNSYSPEKATSYDFKAMYSYIVQYNRDTIKWSAVSAPEAPAAIAAHKARMAENDDIEWRIDLMRGAESQDRTYVRMSNNEAVTAGFEFNYDMTKELNKNRANIYTFADYVPVAGNMMPMSADEATIVPIGVKIAAEGIYTFSIPEGTNGVGVYLIDNIAGTRTNLALTDYEVSLTVGKIEDRFSLEISPIKNTPTGIDNTDAQNSNVRKVMVDGTLYIIKDGKVFDAQGARVK